MNPDQIRYDLKNKLKASRYLHSIGVEEVCHDLAVIYRYDEEKAVLAGILHDCAKYLTDQELLANCEIYRLPVTEIESHCPYLLHAKVGAAFAINKYGITDLDILNAIAYHTTGRPGMSLLEKIVFVSDFIEPNRKSLPGLVEIREAAYTDIDLAVVKTSDNVLQYLYKTGGEIDQLTVETYEYYKSLKDN